MSKFASNQPRRIHLWSTLSVCLMAFAAIPSQAASISFFLNQSNRFPDDINYISVTLTENATGGVDILAKTLDPLNGHNNHVGIQKFAFSFTGETTGSITGLPDSWRVKENKSLKDFGMFDVHLQGKGKARTDSLSFTVNDVDLSNFEPLFAAQATGFRHKHHSHSAYFTGSTPVTPVPIPAAAWLFGAGLMGLMGVARRRQKLAT